MMARTNGKARSAADFLPSRRTLPALARAVQRCQGCDLYLRATQAVFGEGPSDAQLLFVGEQPGDREDIEGRPFVGPAGRLLAEGLAAAGIERDRVYVTNAVKHFKWEARGKRRLHGKPSSREIAACRPWLAAEIDLLEPAGIVCLGATAAQSLLGPKFRITRQRGEIIENVLPSWLLATYHPSAVLRAPDKARRAAMRAEFVEDLQVAARKLSTGNGIR